MFVMNRFLKLQCDLNFGLPVIIVLGIVYSIWSSSFFFFTMAFCFGYDPGRHGEDYLFVKNIRNSYNFLCLTTSILLYYGFKNKNAEYIRFWYLLKLLEFIFIFTSIVPLCFYCWPVTFIAFPIAGFGLFVISTVEAGHRELNIDMNIFSVFKKKSEDQSPIYEETIEKEQENLNPLATNALRFFGFLKIIEILVIVSGLFLVILITQENYQYINYWNIVWFLIGLSILIIVVLRFIWTQIPKQLTDTIETNTIHLESTDN